jgi:hypothetical protein
MIKKIVRNFFRLNIIKETKIKTGIKYYIDEDEKIYKQYTTEINEFIEFIELKDNAVFRNFLREFGVDLDVIIHLRLNKKIEQKELTKMIKEIRDKKIEIAKLDFYKETDIESFIIEIFIQGENNNDEITINMKFLENLKKKIIIEYFKILKETLEKYYKVGV